jgi:hypothetical protein
MNVSGRSGNFRTPSILTDEKHREIDDQLSPILFGDRGVVLVRDEQSGELLTYTRVKRRGILYALWLASPRKRIYLSPAEYEAERRR